MVLTSQTCPSRMSLLLSSLAICMSNLHMLGHAAKLNVHVSPAPWYSLTIHGSYLASAWNQSVSTQINVKHIQSDLVQTIIMLKPNTASRLGTLINAYNDSFQREVVIFKTTSAFEAHSFLNRLDASGVYSRLYVDTSWVTPLYRNQPPMHWYT